ncbi:TetR/AcrR family transcriptional regulator [Thalassobacillus hwangdonensis]|uniref:TetR/AcrR family transcriptional regulator n=1 Tax=Thalassobacillus hwangdonensis TaxID=546108 RepID=A0ABW3KVU8_9BACI
MERKKHILKAANDAFSMFGYKATTVDQVAKAANVGKGTIYNFFDNKEELFREVISELLHEMKMAAEGSFKSDRSFKENVHHALFVLLEYRKSHQLTMKVVQEAKGIGTPTVQLALQEMEELIITYIKEKLQLAVDAGDIRPCKLEPTAFMIYKLYIAFIIDWEENHSPLTKEEILDLFEQSIFKGLSPEG